MTITILIRRLSNMMNLENIRSLGFDHKVVALMFIIKSNGTNVYN